VSYEIFKFVYNVTAVIW